MTDITNTHLEAALLDQSIAGTLRNQRYAFIAIYEEGWRLGVAVANERGYNPITGKTFDNDDEARQWANGLNEHLGLSSGVVSRIIISTMGGRKYEELPACSRASTLY